VCHEASAHNTLHSAHISSDYAKNYFQSRISQSLPTSERGRWSNIAFTTKMLKDVGEKME